MPFSLFMAAISRSLPPARRTQRRRLFTAQRRRITRYYARPRLGRPCRASILITLTSRGPLMFGFAMTVL